ncbi:hypothetical protein [Lentilactobacillus hilgardii]|uniref:hypothetical protein n=1 Tax=Lentilactobacillus hilgardii TaxID=1588 RepID=UPI0021A507DD|nr:hypothetical protein [Lentilactobacillus hilgardii]
MIIAVKDTKYHKVMDESTMAQTLRKEDGIRTYAWQINESIKKHRNLRGWKLVKK